MRNVGWASECRDLLVGELATGGINIFAPAFSESGVDPVFLQIGHEVGSGDFVRLAKAGEFNRIVFYDVYQVGWYLSINLDQIIRILLAVVELVEEDVFEGDLITGLRVLVVDRVRQ